MFKRIKAWFKTRYDAWINRLIDANKRQYGAKGPSCCDFETKPTLHGKDS